MKRSTQKKQSGGEYASVDGNYSIPTPFSSWLADLGENSAGSDQMMAGQVGGKKKKSPKKKTASKKTASKKTASKKKVVKRKKPMKGGELYLQNIGVDDVANPLASLQVVDNNAGNLGLNGIPNPYASLEVVDYKFGGKKKVSSKKKSVSKKTASKKKVVKRKRSMKGGEYAPVGEDSMILTPGSHWSADLNRSSGVSSQMLADQTGGKKKKRSVAKKSAPKKKSTSTKKKVVKRQKTVKKSS